MMRSAWTSLVEQGRAILDDPSHVLGHKRPGAALEPHVTHCFDYIRQALMCYSDVTLEPWLDYDGLHLTRDGSSGWGVQHVCRPFDRLVEWTNENAPDDDAYV